MSVRPIAVRPRQKADPFADVIRTKARTFAFAARFLGPEPRRATIVLYAFFRHVDDLVDERASEADVAPIHRALDAWDGWLATLDRSGRNGPPLGHLSPAGRSEAAGDPLDALGERRALATALAAVLIEYDIPSAYPRALLRGLRDDLESRPIQTFDDLERYAFRVAATVGLSMCHVLGATSPRALEAATALGIAMQLTNILRDVGEDLAIGRLYLPADELEQFGCSRQTLGARSVDRPFRDLLRFQIERTRRYYALGLAGVRELPPEARFPILLAARLYGRILDKIEDQGYDVFARRASVGRLEKIALAGRLAAELRVPTRATVPWTGMTQPLPVHQDRLGVAALEELRVCHESSGRHR